MTSRILAFDLDGSAGPTSIYNGKDGLRPMCMYFYYVVSTDDGVGYAVKSFYYDNGDIAIPDEWDVIARLANNARYDSFTPPPFAQTFDAYPWRRKSYLAIVLDDVDWSFVEGGAFEISKKYPISSNNNCFMEAHDRDIDVGGGRIASAVCCTNYLCDEWGIPLEAGQEEYYSITMQLSKRDKSSLFGVTIDPGGNNLGPPVSPP
ncbi:MAG TPA: hypothetical protein VGF77_15990 [Allosphingosinicella sp.]|jgi:hypothetical protein